jgi:hypothetical protein
MLLEAAYAAEIRKLVEYVDRNNERSTKTDCQKAPTQQLSCVKES